MMWADKVDFPLPGGALNQVTQDSCFVSNHDRMPGSWSSQSQVPGIHKRRTKLKSSSEPEETAKNFSRSFASSGIRVPIAAIPRDRKRLTRELRALRTLT